MNWLQKIAKPVSVEQTWNGITATLNYICNTATWRMTSIRKLEMVPGSNWFSMSYAGTKKSGGGLQADFRLTVSMRWSGEMEEQYNTTVGSNKLEFAAQLYDGDGDPITDEETFDTATEVAMFVKGNMDDDNKFTEPEPTPVMPQESAPTTPASPQLEPVLV